MEDRTSDPWITNPISPFNWAEHIYTVHHGLQKRNFNTTHDPRIDVNKPNDIRKNVSTPNVVQDIFTVLFSISL